MIYYAFSDYLKQRYGEKVYKLPIGLPLTCPNRDGSCGKFGCTFCGSIGAGYENLPPELSVSEQIRMNKEHIVPKYKAKKFIPYFQNFSNTYMPPEQLNPQRDATVLPTTDIFSFGVMMYQMVTGSLPFGPLDSEGDLVPYIRRGKAGDWDRRSLFQTEGGREWAPIIEGCLVPRFQERLQTADDVLRLVPHAQRHEPPAEEHCDFQRRIVNGVLLRVMQGEDYGRVYYLDSLLRGSSAILRMGRRDSTADNDIAITEEESCYISRKHCTLELDYDRGTWIIRDGQWDRYGTGGWRRSTNGTFVNSREVGPDGLPFAPGDIISIGDAKLRAEGY